MNRTVFKIFFVALLAIISLQTFAQNTTAHQAKKSKVLVIGAHPDDAETCCGGTILKLREAGHEVVLVYLTKGQAGIPGKSKKEAGAIREQEALNACKLMDVRPVFMTQVDGSAEVTAERYDEMYNVIKQENPDIVFTHWPIDLHPDHGVCASLVIEAWNRLGYKFDLYFFEPMTGSQAQLFSPTDYVDITDVAEKKYEVCMCHASQGLDEVYEIWHDVMERFRGIEFRCKRAEAFIHLRRNDSDIFEK